MIILDTHILYWWVNRTEGKLTEAHIDLIESADTLAISVMTCWEMVWLVKHGRISLKVPVSAWLDAVEMCGVTVVPVSRAIAEISVNLPEHHKDPVDRIIIATAIEHKAQVLSADQRFPEYPEITNLLVSI